MHCLFNTDTHEIQPGRPDRADPGGLLRRPAPAARCSVLLRRSDLPGPQKIVPKPGLRKKFRKMFTKPKICCIVP